MRFSEYFFIFPTISNFSLQPCLSNVDLDNDVFDNNKNVFHQGCVCGGCFKRVDPLLLLFSFLFILACELVLYEAPEIKMIIDNMALVIKHTMLRKFLVLGGSTRLHRSSQDCVLLPVRKIKLK